MKNDELLHKWVNGDLTAEELETFKKRPEYDSLVELYANTKDLAAPEFDQQAMLREILESNKKATPTSTPTRTPTLQWIRYAAAAIIILSAAWFLWPRDAMVLHEVARGDRLEGTLPDGSTFILNAESTLSYDSKNWSNNRRLELAGEAFFKVEKGTKFSVHTSNGSVQVLGTEFNVRSRENTMEVKCETGKVAILAPDGKTIDELTANQIIRLKDGALEEKWITTSKDKGIWVVGISRFRKVRLQMVLDELSRQFDVNINPGDIDVDVIISCNFQHRNLDLALQTTLGPMNVLYEIKDDGVVLYR